MTKIKMPTKKHWLVLRWVTAGIPSRYLTKPPRPTQPGHPFMGRQNEY